MKMKDKPMREYACEDYGLAFAKQDRPTQARAALETRHQ